jgi:hypothetical protein
MTEILALLQPLKHSISKTTLKQMSRINTAMMAMSGRVTMLGISRWAGTGGSSPVSNDFLHHHSLATRDITQKWAMPIFNWAAILNQLVIRFEDRLSL